MTLGAGTPGLPDLDLEQLTLGVGRRLPPASPGPRGDHLPIPCAASGRDLTAPYFYTCHLYLYFIFLIEMVSSGSFYAVLTVHHLFAPRWLCRAACGRR